MPGALTVGMCEDFLSVDGFTDITIDIRHRYAEEDLLSDAPQDLAALPPEVVHNLVGRFTSCNISAYKPVN